MYILLITLPVLVPTFAYMIINAMLVTGHLKNTFFLVGDEQALAHRRFLSAVGVAEDKDGYAVLNRKDQVPAEVS